MPSLIFENVIAKWTFLRPTVFFGQKERNPVVDPDLLIRERGGHSDPWIRGEWSRTNFFRPLGA